MELHEDMLAYAEERQDAFKDHCSSLQNFEYCEPVFFQGDCLKLSLETRYYDRIYCSGILPEGYDFFLRIYLKPGGVLVYPRDTKTLVKIWLGPFNRYITETDPNLSSRELRVYPFTAEKSGDLAQLREYFILFIYAGFTFKGFC
jgi:protein-L-isoaspartate O-methyltransferase